MIMGMATSLKNVLNPESYYQDYFTIAANNFYYSVQESSEILKENYLRIEPEYTGTFISLDSTSPESLNVLKQVGS